MQPAPFFKGHAGLKHLPIPGQTCKNAMVFSKVIGGEMISGKGEFKPGDTLVLVDSKDRNYLVTIRMARMKSR
jgi:hypothetical protein